jgi:hypothetical protein
MSTSATGTNSSCARCHQTQDQLDEPMKRCTGCRSVLYCSRDCQKLTWKTHKSACHTIQAIEAPPEQNNRTTMSLNFNDFSKLAKEQTSSTDNGDGSSSSDDAETIYYLETSTPHTYDISLSGPYFPLDSIIRQVMHNFGDECRPGQFPFPSPNTTTTTQAILIPPPSTPRPRSLPTNPPKRPRRRLLAHHLAHKQQPQPHQNHPPHLRAQPKPGLQTPLPHLGGNANRNELRHGGHNRRAKPRKQIATDQKLETQGLVFETKPSGRESAASRRTAESEYLRLEDCGSVGAHAGRVVAGYHQ